MSNWKYKGQDIKVLPECFGFTYKIWLIKDIECFKNVLNVIINACVVWYTHEFNQLKQKKENHQIKTIYGMLL